MPHLLDWLATAGPDAAVLQETKLEDERFPHEQSREAGYHAVFLGQKTYNGVALLSRTPARDVVRNIPAHGDAQARVIAGTVDGFGWWEPTFPMARRRAARSSPTRWRGWKRCGRGWRASWPRIRAWR